MDDDEIKKEFVEAALGAELNDGLSCAKHQQLGKNLVRFSS